jgi:hypothetical protein
MNRDKKTAGILKQLFLIFGLGIALLVFALFSSGIFFTGIVVQSSNSAIVNAHK